MKVSKYEEDKTNVEFKIAAQDSAFESGVMNLGELSPFTCPECHGVLSVINDGKLTRFRCHTGHAYSPDTLLAALTENIEDDMWNAIRSVEESVMLLNHIGDHFAEVNNGKLAAAYFAKANEATHRIALLRQAVMSHENLAIEAIDLDTDENTEASAGGNGGSPANASA